MCLSDYVKINSKKYPLKKSRKLKSHSMLYKINAQVCIKSTRNFEVCLMLLIIKPSFFDNCKLIKVFKKYSICYIFFLITAVASVSVDDVPSWTQTAWIFPSPSPTTTSRSLRALWRPPPSSRSLRFQIVDSAIASSSSQGTKEVNSLCNRVITSQLSTSLEVLRDPRNSTWKWRWKFIKMEFLPLVIFPRFYLMWQSILFESERERESEREITGKCYQHNLCFLFLMIKLMKNLWFLCF